MILSVILPQGSSGAAAAAMVSIVSVVHRGASYPSYTPQARVIVAAALWTMFFLTSHQWGCLIHGSSFFSSFSSVNLSWRPITRIISGLFSPLVSQLSYHSWFRVLALFLLTFKFWPRLKPLSTLKLSFHPRWERNSCLGLHTFLHVFVRSVNAATHQIIPSSILCWATDLCSSGLLESWFVLWAN